MTISDISIFLFFVFIFSVLVTGVVRKYSIKYSVIDIPNERSSHIYPTPRGGGLSILLSIIITLGMLYYLRLMPLDIILALSGGFLVGIIGWLDDHRHMPIIWRALCYTSASIWAVYWIDVANIGFINEDIAWVPFIVSIFIVVGLVWVTNLYNFMDGTDGLAAIQAISTACFLGVIFLISKHKDLTIFCFAIASASAGFLCWNWPHAKIFMGDVGSCLLGFIFGTLALIGVKSGIFSISVWYILMSIFICDATLTLTLRIIKKERWYIAHRSHAYQRALQLGCTQLGLIWAVLIINMILIWPLAYITYRWENYSFLNVSIITIMLCIIWGGIQLRFKKYSEHL